MNTIQNPILRGFNPDPSIIRVDDDFYIATSTFEWFPGVQIYHSRDLAHWELAAHPLTSVSQLDMAGVPSSGGVWAPCLSYSDGTYYLIYTDAKVISSQYRDMHNYLVTAKDVRGEWSEPVYLNSTGFDPSLFHDDDGRKWLVNVVTDHRKGRNFFAGIVVQEYDGREQRLKGPITKIWETVPGEIVEGPHLYRYNGWYYLLVAEGGTGLKHAVRMARSRSLTGPYEKDPQREVLTSKYDPALPLQKAGHADLVETQGGEWYMVHLASRPIPSMGRCTLGRETCVQKVNWTKDGWLRLAQGGVAPAMRVPAPELPVFTAETPPSRDHFDAPVPGMQYQSLRVPLAGRFSLTERPGFLRLKGGESLSSFHRQTLLARRWQSFRFTAETCVEFEPENYNQMAGLILLYDTMNFYYLRVSRDEVLGKTLNVLTSVNGKYDEPMGNEVCVEGVRRLYLRAEVDYDCLQFRFSADGHDFKAIGPVLDASTLSDEACVKAFFTGAFVGMCCQDLTGRRRPADFDYFDYVER